jgi:hypothetical protein
MNCSVVQVLERRQLHPQTATDGRLGDSVPFEREHTEDEIAQHNAGLKAGLAGEPNDNTKTFTWQRGLADAQE